LVYFGAFQENIFHAFVHHQIHIALTVTLFGVFECIESHTIFIFYNGKWFKRFAQHGKFVCMYTDFAHLGTKNKTFDTNKITNIEQFLENGIVHFGLCFGAYVIATHIYLNTSFRVL